MPFYNFFLWDVVVRLFFPTAFSSSFFPACLLAVRRLSVEGFLFLVSLRILVYIYMPLMDLAVPVVHDPSNDYMVMPPLGQTSDA